MEGLCVMSSYKHDDILRHFFGAYFHQDWNLEAEDKTQVVQYYLQLEEVSPEDAARLRADMIAYVENEPDDDVLEEKLCTDLGCYYNTHADGLTAREWMLGIADLLVMKT